MKTKNKLKITSVLALILAMMLVFSSCSQKEAGKSNEEESQTAQKQEINSVEESESDGFINIVLDEDKITVDGSDISGDSSQEVFVSKKIETHPEVTKEVENTVINITQIGEYKFTGEAKNTQILVDIEKSIEGGTRLVLDNLNISCETAPAILVLSAQETEQAGTGGVILELAENSQNIITGSHTSKDEENNITTKNDGAISSNVSIIIEGSGELEVFADKEGIESKMHLTINSGEIVVNSNDDAINASEDGVSHITINGGTITANSTLGSEGDGIDSNGYISINGGTVFAFANETSMDSGLDSDLGTVINGGVVVATGNMYDEIKKGGSQELIFTSFTEKIQDRITLVDSDENPVFSFDLPYSASTLCFSSPDLKSEKYTLYIDGDVVGEKIDSLTLLPTSFSGGTQLEGSVGISGGPGGGGGMPDMGDQPNGSQKPDESDRPKMPGQPGDDSFDGDVGDRPAPWGDKKDNADIKLSEIFDLGISNVFSNVQKIAE